MNIAGVLEVGGYDLIILGSGALSVISLTNLLVKIMF